MSVATYTDLLAEVPAWLRRGDLTPEIPTFIALAEAQMNRRLRTAQMLSRAQLPIASALMAVPVDFIAPRSARLVGACGPSTLKWASEEQMDTLTDGWDFAPGQPRHYSVEGSNFRFSPDPGTGAYTVALSYYARIPALSVSNASNWLLAAHPDAYLYGALTQSAPYLRADDRFQMWGSLFTQIVADINASEIGLGGLLEVQPSHHGI